MPLINVAFKVNTAQNPAWAHGDINVPTGGTSFNVVHEAINYNANANDMVCATAAIQVTLPAAASCGGQAVVVYNQTDGGAMVTVVPAGGDTITGAANATIAARGSLEFLSDGVSDWAVLQ